MKTLKNIAVALVVILMVDGCVYRDPGVTLSHGCSIVAISASSPCWLEYTSWHDDRAYSDYAATRSIDTSTNKPAFSLVSESEVLNFTSETDWLSAIQRHKASPDDSYLQLEDIHAFAANDNHVIGTYGGGQFILDIQSNALRTYADEAKWSSVVARDTGLSSKALRDPKSFFVQSRHLFMIVGYVMLLFGAVASGWRSRKSRITKP